MKEEKLISHSPLPLYYQIDTILESRIKSGELKAGEKIDSEPVLAKKFKVGRPTVRQALDYLKSKGLIFKKKGSGTYVADTKNRKEILIFDLIGITEAVKKENLNLRKKIVDEIKIIRVDNASNPFFEKSVYFFSRLDIIENKPLIFEKFYLDISLFPDVKNYNLEKIQLSELVENTYCLQVYQIKQVFKAVIGNDELRKIFNQKKNFPLLLVKRGIFFEEKPGIFVEMWINTEEFDFSQILKK